MSENIINLLKLCDDPKIYPQVLYKLLNTSNLNIESLKKYSKSDCLFDENQKEAIKNLYNDIKKSKFLENLLENINQTDFSLANFIFDIHEFIFIDEVNTYSKSFFDSLIFNIKKDLVDIDGSVEILQVIYKNVISLFEVINDKNISYCNINDIFKTKKINNYTLSLLILIISDRLKLPIFGIPIKNDIVLCLSKEYCYHYEMVYSEDILFYFSANDFTIFYTKNDIINLVSKFRYEYDEKLFLPKSNSFIIQHWLFFIEKLNCNNVNIKKLSNNFQQIIYILTENI